MRRLSILVLIVVIACMASARPASAEKRLALVIAVQNYKNLPQLANTISDANLIAEKLRAAEFDVDVTLDPGKTDLTAALRNFGRKVEASGPDAVALVYYAGHGVQNRKQVNYIVGADADLKSDVDLPIEAFPIDNVLQNLEEARPKLIFAIFDACRDDPLPSISTRGTHRGLAPEVDLPGGTLIAYSTKPGDAADDGPPGGHSPFAVALADGLSERGVESRRMFDVVARQVLKATSSKQFPWVESPTKTSDFYFLNGPAPSNATPTPAPTGTTSGSVRFDAGEADYDRLVTSVNPEDYTDWMRKYPDHPLLENVKKMRRRLAEDALWKRAEAAASIADKLIALRILLDAFPPPDGVYAEKALEKQRELSAYETRPTDTPTPGPRVSRVRQFQNMDAPGNDLGDWIADSDLDKCEAKCQSDPNCLGYTFNIVASACFPKSRIAQLVASTEAAVTGVILDRVPDLDAIISGSRVVRKEFRHNSGQVSLGFDMGKPLSVHIEGCEEACGGDAACRGYVYDLQTSTCWLKTAIGPLKASRIPAVTGVAVDAALAPDFHSPSAPRLRTYMGQILIGFDLGGKLNVPITSCTETCVRESRCAGYVYDLQASACYLKSSVGPLTTSRIAAETVFVDRD